MRRIGPVVLAATLAACTTAPTGPEAVALELFDLASRRPLSVERIETLFEVPAGDPRRVALLDALDGLRDAGTLEVTGVESLRDLQRTAVDLRARRDGGGSASYSVQLERTDRGWVVRWFGGPGIEWPPPRRRHDQGLSSSAPPRAGGPARRD